MTELRFPWDDPDEPRAPRDAPLTPGRRPRGRRPGAAITPAAEGWYPGGFALSGPAAGVAAFAAAACGPGITPWAEAPSLQAEEILQRLLAVPLADRGLDLEGARRLVRQLTDAVSAHHAQASSWARSEQGQRAQPLDLHRLIPVPQAMLARGAADPASLRWCARHWGLHRLRRVRVEEAGAGEKRYRFWALGGQGLRLERLAAAWPDLAFRTLPSAGA